MPPTPSRKRKSAASEKVEEPPKSSAGGSSSAHSTPAKKRASRGKGKNDTVINLDVDDPFSFDSKSDTHPEPLKNISVERTAFGGMKFSRSPPSSSERYATLEKIAERRGNISGFSSSAVRPSPVSSLSAGLQLGLSSSSATSRSSTPKVKGKKRSVHNQSSIEAYQMGEEEGKESADESLKGKSTPVAPESSAKRRSKASAFTEAAASIYEEKKPNTEDLYKVPELNPIEQLEVDHAIEEHQLLNPGARVLALWGHEFYAAYVCGRDGLSRYFVHFVEDNLNRLLPPTGVIPLALLSAGHKISFISSVDDEEVGKAAEIVAVPSSDDAEEWVEGLFELREADADEKETQKVSWEKIYLTKDQRSKINVSPVNSTVFIDRENIVNESRSSRRSRTTRFSNETLANVTGNLTSPQPSVSRSVRASRTPKTPKAPAVALAEDEVESEASTPKTEGKKRSRGRKSSPPASNTATSATRSSPRRKSVAAEPDDEQKVNEKEQQPKKAETPQQGEPQVEQPVVEMMEEKSEEPTPAQEQPAEKEKEPTKEEEVPSTVISVSIEEQSPPPVEEPVEEKEENHKQGEQSTQEVPEVNGNTTTTGELSFNLDQLNGSTTEDESQANNTTKTNITTNGSPTKTDNGDDQSMTAMEFLATNDGPSPKKVESTPSPAPTPVPATPQATSSEKPAVNLNLFENMKFVLTSAPRSKKNSDFNKRDYRTKIEERGGEMIDDFSSLQEGDKAFLIADTYYRTHKYLSALSLSVPCVKHNWIQECVTQEKLIDFMPFMLPAGESTLDPTQIYDWKPLKGSLLRDKRVWVYSNLDSKDNVMSFVDIWSSIIRNLGADVVVDMPLTLMEKLEQCRENPVNILLSDPTCEKAIAERVEAEGGIAVSSEWVIQAIVTGELPEVSTSERFRFDSIP